jgi:hypothetical protein
MELESGPLKPHLVDFSRIGDPQVGYISFAQNGGTLPFDIQRVFWTYFTPEEVVRGRHAHHNTQMILIAAAGRIVVNTELVDGSLDIFVLEKPHQGVYLPTLCWHTMQYSHNAVQLVLASGPYVESDYIRDYKAFKSMNKQV